MRGIVITNSITSRESEAFNKYLKEVSKIEGFESAEAEAECAFRAMNGDEEAREELIKRNLRFVVSCAKQYKVKGVLLRDLVNEGNIGMITAAGRFDPSKGFKFISFAVWYINKSIKEYLTNNSRLIRLPNNKVDALNKYKKMLSCLEQRLERTPSTDDIIESCGNDYTVDDIEVLNALLYNDITSLDNPIGEDGATVMDLVGDSSMGNADMLVVKSEIEVNINNILSTLKPMDKTIIIKLFGLDGETPSTLEDVGDMFNMSRESIRQKKEKVFKTLRGKFNVNLRDLIND